MTAENFSPENTGILRFMRRLAAPSNAITDPGQRRQAYLLTTVLLLLIPVGLLVAIGLHFITPETADTQDRAISLMVGASLGLLGAYAISRTSFLTFATVLALAVSVLTIIAAAFFGDEMARLDLLNYLVVPVLFAGLLLPIRFVVMFALVNTAGLVGLAAIAPPVLFYTIASGPLSFNIVVSSLILLVFYHRDALERVRRAELAHRQERLREALAKEQELNELKSRFVSMVSHEFRNPLAGIMTTSSILESYDDRLTDAQRREKIGSIQMQVNRLTDLLEDILVIGKSGVVGLQAKTEQIGLPGFCQALAEELQQIGIGPNPIRFTVNGRCDAALADPKLLRQLITNLLTNAVKYSPDGAAVEFELRCAGETATLRVRDSGIGIPEDDQARLFEVFHRAGNVGNIAGTGLGLVIAKLAAEAHGGTIIFESVPGEGTTFTVTLPVLSPQRRKP